MQKRGHVSSVSALGLSQESYPQAYVASEVEARLFRRCAITQIPKAELPHDEGGITDWLQFRTIVTPSIAYLQS